MHLTNVAIQKHSEGYSHAHGGKWSLKNLRQYIEGTRGTPAAVTLMEDVGWVIVHSLKAVQNVIINDKHCFECYGFDIMIDNKLKPWLLEVNASPSLSTTTLDDKQLKTQLIDEVLDLAVPPHMIEAAQSSCKPARPRRGSTSAAAAGFPTNFELLYDEAIEIEAGRRAVEASAARAGGRRGSEATGGGQWSKVASGRRAFNTPHWA